MDIADLELYKAFDLMVQHDLAKKLESHKSAGHTLKLTDRPQKKSHHLIEILMKSSTRKGSMSICLFYCLVVSKKES